RELWLSRDDEGRAAGRPRVCRGAWAGSTDQGQCIGRCRFGSIAAVTCHTKLPHGQKEAILRDWFSGSMITVAIAAAGSALVSVSIAPAGAQVPVAVGTGADNVLGRARSTGHLDG